MTELFPSFNSDQKNEEAVTERKYQFGGEAKNCDAFFDVSLSASRRMLPKVPIIYRTTA